MQVNGGPESQPMLPVRRLNNFVFGPRLFYFQWVENSFQERGDNNHPKNLRRAAKAMAGFGVRLQFSVSECVLDPLRLERCQAALDAIVNHGEDPVLFVSLGPLVNDASLSINALGRPYRVRSRVTIV